MSVLIYILGWKASHLGELPIVWGLYGLGRKRGVKTFRRITLKTGGFEMEGKFLFVRLSLGATSCLFSF